MIDLLEIVKSSAGRDDKKNPNASLSISKQILDATDRLKTLKETVITTPELNVIFNGDYVILDVKFPTASSGELRVFWKGLEDFGNMQNEYFGKSDSPIFNVVVHPSKFSGEYFYSLINPVNWALQPASPGAAINVIRILFEKQALNIFAFDKTDIKSMDAEIEREVNEENRLTKQEEKKIAEREKYQEKINQQLDSIFE